MMCSTWRAAMDDGVNPHTFDGLVWVSTNVSKIWHHCLRMQHVDIMPQMCIFAIIDPQGTILHSLHYNALDYITLHHTQLIALHYN